VSSQPTYIKPCILLGVIFVSSFCRVSLVEYLPVLRVYSHLVAGSSFLLVT
jgi:hypothetical protein